VGWDLESDPVHLLAILVQDSLQGLLVEDSLKGLMVNLVLTFLVEDNHRQRHQIHQIHWYQID
jgi:hypothetical protein